MDGKTWEEMFWSVVPVQKGHEKQMSVGYYFLCFCLEDKSTYFKEIGVVNEWNMSLSEW
jgi:hypothetical protein